MNTNRLFEKAFSFVYSHRMNSYLEGADLAAIYAHEMKNYLEKHGHAVHYNDVYDYACHMLGLNDNQAA